MKIAVFLIVFYQRVISPFLPRVCRFYPSCSEYARQAIEKYGLRKGSLMAIKRLLRCHPVNAGGCDPVR
jgi:putative membrane protein insertion efficiency factor